MDKKGFTMPKNSELIKTITLSSSRNGVISVAHLDHPYGENSEPVVSIGVSLQGDTRNPEWQVHIPYRDIDALIGALKEAKERNEARDPGYHPHDELASDTGGGY
jgi:hypothetical protein